MNFTQKQEIIAEIRNRLQACRAVLDLLSSDKMPSKNLIAKAQAEMDEAVKLISTLNKT